MKVIELQVEDIIPYDNNPRFNEGAVEKVMEGIKEFGFQNPILVDVNNVIIAGHTRLKAALEIGLKKVPCIVSEELSPEQVKAFRITDNRTSEFAEWDTRLLIGEIDELDLSGFDVDMTGFELVDIEKIRLGIFNEDEKQEEKDDDDKPEVTGIIQYNIIFNDELEQVEWQKFLLYLKNEYPDIETISERLIHYIGGTL